VDEPADDVSKDLVGDHARRGAEALELLVIAGLAIGDSRG
jgi:hypothetical protein